MSSAKLSNSTGWSTHFSSDTGMLAGSVSSWQILLALWKLLFDSASAAREVLSEQRRIFRMCTVQPIAAATAWIVVTIVLDSAHLVLYPFSHIATELALSTQQVT
jgi:hypothetical protein